MALYLQAQVTLKMLSIFSFTYDFCRSFTPTLEAFILWSVAVSRVTLVSPCGEGHRCCKQQCSPLLFITFQSQVLFQRSHFIPHVYSFLFLVFFCVSEKSALTSDEGRKKINHAVCLYQLKSLRKATVNIHFGHKKVWSITCQDQV